ncbi:MAG: hypothetical protein CMP11_05170 [Zetaproteobacteria bacterium]|nr:hypothetical protein [Pseudobdellovibrionaceae bacterium]|tara:strand:+ start:175 stop:579 length:405 start_codon:yes stop_codon:yes gene_type:complete
MKTKILVFFSVLFFLSCGLGANSNSKAMESQEKKSFKVSFSASKNFSSDSILSKQGNTFHSFLVEGVDQGKVLTQIKIRTCCGSNMTFDKDKLIKKSNNSYIVNVDKGMKIQPEMTFTLVDESGSKTVHNTIQG